MGEGGARRQVLIWDLPTRIFHWLLVVLIPFQWWTAEEELIDLHRTGGLVILGLLVFRILWGLFGTSTARFSHFVRGPRRVISYLKGPEAPSIGHNPLGGLSVVALLGLLIVEVGLGLFSADDDGLESGPLAHLVSTGLSEVLAELHEEAFDILLVLIGLHLAAILFYTLVRRKNLVGPMIGGRGDVTEGVAGAEPASVWRFLFAAVIALAVTLWLGNGASL